MLRVLLSLLVLGVTLYALIDCLRTPAEQVRNLPKVLWMLLIVLLAVVGPLAWLLVGRQRPAPGPRRSRPRPVAPDDDPDFLRDLDVERRRREQQGETDPPA